MTDQHLQESSLDGGSEEGDPVQVVVDRALAAHIMQLTTAALREKARADTFAAQLAETKDRLYDTERCMDVMREAATRLRPLIRDGATNDAIEAAQWISAQRPENWRPE